MFAIVLITSLIFTYLVINFVAVLIRNQKAFKFYDQNCPNLPIAPNPSIFSGHLLSIIMNNDSWKIITKLHDKYGPSFGMFYADQPWVATKDLDLIKLIEIDDAKKHVNRAFLGGPLKHFNNSIFQLLDEDWRGARHVIAPALTNYVVKSEEVTSGVNIVVGKFSNSLTRKLNKAKALGGSSFELEVRDSFERFALAVIFLVSYKQDDIIDFDAEQDKWAQLFAKGARDGSSPLVLISMMFPFLRGIITFLSRLSPFGVWEASIIKHIEGAMQAKKLQPDTKTNGPTAQIGKSKGTLLDTVIEGYMAKKVNYDHFMGSLLLLVLAGAITTADTISCLIWQLAKNPDIQERLRKSLAEDGIESEYLTWCINETIRWHPAVPVGTGRILGENIEVNGQFLPKGTFVMPSTHSIHHDPKIWPEPEKFNPDRWINRADFHPAAFVGFGLGPRNCLGRYLAVHEMKLVIKMLLAEYKIETCAKTLTEWRFHVPAMLYTLLDKPLIVKLTPLSST